MSNVTKFLGFDIKDSYARQEIAQMKINFQGGVDTIYDAIVAQGITPSSSTPNDCATAITQIGTTQYNNGRSQGRKDVGNTHNVTTSGVSAVSTVTGKYYAVMIGYSSPGSTARDIQITSGCTVLASYNYKIGTTSSYGTANCKLFFIKATSTSFTFDSTAITSGLVALIELGAYE